MKEFSKQELIDFINRAETEEKAIVAYEFIKDKTPYLDEEVRNHLLLLAEDKQSSFWPEEENPFLPDYMTIRDEEGDYSPSAPWGAPGMKISDFITGVRYW